MVDPPQDRDQPQAPWITLVCLIFLSILSQGCASVRTRHPVPAHLLKESNIAGMSGVRDWGDAFSPILHRSAVESVRQELNALPSKSPDSLSKESIEILALSGGGADGAFGAGLLCGWTVYGNRPRFKLVTGISTGALIAPFAFLGPEYDAKLKKIYTTVSTKNIFRPKSLFKILGTDSLGDTQPLAELAARYVDEKMIQAIAAEHAKGRRLWIGTTQLDAQRLMIWDIGAIASSGHSQALELFRQILIASAAIPVMFPPVYITVEAGGKRYDEMHVDGGTTAQVFAYGFIIHPFAVSAEARVRQSPRSKNLYIIRNSKIKPVWSHVKPRLKAIAKRSISTLIKYQGIGDLYRLYTIALRDGLDYNLAYIPEDFNVDPNEEFDRDYMNQLFALGYHLACQGYPWKKHPPGFKTFTKPKADR